MFDAKDNKDNALKTNGRITFLDGFCIITLVEVSLSVLEQTILILKSMKREADEMSNDGKGSSRLIISGYPVDDWIDDCMVVYNAKMNVLGEENNG